MTLSSHIISWQKKHGRHDLPWQINRTPYRVWVSEIMLQQTQVTTVIGYFDRFMHQCPTVEKLAQLDNDHLMTLWQGLGYYSRARNLKKSAQIIMDLHDGRLPNTLHGLIQLPGIGQSTAAAIMALAHNQPEAILDGNVKRVLCRYHGIQTDPKSKDALNTLWLHAKTHGKNNEPRVYTQGIMDLGATICKPKKPICTQCPLSKKCVANQQGLQDQIPKKQPKRPKKKVDLFVLVQTHKGHISLNKRPSTGIWSQLYTPDIFDDLDALYDKHPNAQALSPYKHLLTHIELTIHPFIDIASELSGSKTSPINQLQYPIPKGIEQTIKQAQAHLTQLELHQNNTTLKN